MENIEHFKKTREEGLSPSKTEEDVVETKKRGRPRIMRTEEEKAALLLRRKTLRATKAKNKVSSWKSARECLDLPKGQMFEADGQNKSEQELRHISEGTKSVAPLQETEGKKKRKPLRAIPEPGTPRPSEKVGPNARDYFEEEGYSPNDEWFDQQKAAALEETFREMTAAAFVATFNKAKEEGSLNRVSSTLFPLFLLDFLQLSPYDSPNDGWPDQQDAEAGRD
jgi:hypothetical protein